MVKKHLIRNPKIVLTNYVLFSLKAQKSFSLIFQYKFGVRQKSMVGKPRGAMVLPCRVNKKLLDLGPRGPKVPKKSKNS